MIDWTKATTGELVDRIRGGVNEFDSRLQHTVDDTLAALAELERRVTGRLVEKDMADAPVEMDNAEASAWACGYNAAVEDLT